MKNMTKFLTTLFATLALLFVGGQVNAQSVDTGAGGTASITIDNAAQGQTYTIYKLFDATVDGNGAISYKVPTGKTLQEMISLALINLEMFLLRTTLMFQAMPSKLGQRVLEQK